MRLVFTANNRPYYFEDVMRHWSQVRGFQDWSPTVFLEPSSAQNAMIGIADGAGAAVRLNERRLGVLSNPWLALEAGFLADDFVVLAEDDVIVSDDILEYFTWAADAFQGEHVLAVCAATFAHDCPPELEYAAYRHNGGFCPLVWGTWRDRWYDVLRDTWDHDYSSGTPDAPQSGWDWNINLRLMKDWDIVSPKASRSDHIGQLNGTHTTPQSFPGSIAHTFKPHRAGGTYVLADR